MKINGFYLVLTEPPPRRILVELVWRQYVFINNINLRLMITETYERSNTMDNLFIHGLYTLHCQSTKRI